MLWFICFFNYADRVAINSLLPELQKLYGFTKAQQGLISSAFTWLYAVSSPIAGHVGDRRSRKWVIIGGMYIWSMVTGFTAACTRLWQFVAVRGAEGIGEAFYMPASMALISDYHGPKTRSRAIGIHQTSIYAGTVFGSTVAAYLAKKYSWQVPFLFFAIAGCALGLLLSLFIRDRKRPQDEQGTEATPHLPVRQFLAEFAKTPTAVRLVAAYFFANIVQFIFLTWMPTFMKEKFGVSLVLAGFAGTFFIQIFSMVGAAVGGVLADHHANKRKAGRIQFQMVAALAGAPFIFLCGYTTLPVLLVLAMSMYGFFKGIYDASLTASFYDVIAAPRRATSTGLMNFIGWIGAGLGAWMVGVAADHRISMSISISSAAVLYAMCAVFLAAAARTAAKDMLPA